MDGVRAGHSRAGWVTPLILTCGMVSMSGCSSGPSDAVKQVCAIAAGTGTVIVNGRAVHVGTSFSTASFLRDAEASGGPTFATEMQTWLAATGPERSVAAAGLVRECHNIGAL